jgi:predicted aspartyl protease
MLLSTLIGDAPVKLFLLDTGSTNNLISPSAAEEVTRVHGDARILQGLNGSVKNVYRADKAIIQFAHMRQENQGLLAIDMSHMSDRIGTEVSGVLGFEVLRLLDMKIDYRDGLVSFSLDPRRRYF